MSGSPLVLASVVLVLSLGSSCSREPEQGKPEQAKSEKAEPEKIEPKPEKVEPPTSPTPPTAAGPDVPLTYDDGAFSVRGLREDFDAQIAHFDAQIEALGKEEIPDKEILVRAWVVKIYEPPPDCLDCPYPHVFVADGPAVEDPELSLLVGPTAFPTVPNAAIKPSKEEEEFWARQPEVVLEVGKQYSFKGSFKRWAVGFTDPKGVLQFIASRDGAAEWVYAPGPAHPKMNELKEIWAAQDAAMMEQMQKADRRR